MLALLAPLASLLGIEVEALTTRLRRQAIIWSITGVFIAIGVLFLLVAANAALTLQFGPVVAPLMLAGGALLVALIVYGFNDLTAARARREREHKRQSNERTALITSAAVTAFPLLVRSPIFKKIGLPLGSALAAAYVLSRTNSARQDEEE